MNKNIPIEELLNQIYNEPDLGQEVFEYLAPHVLKAYELVKIKDSNKLNKIKFFSSEEDKVNLETILSKNLPNIVDIYTKLPMEYRNMHILKTRKTHRETLLENIQTLVKKMQEIEKEQYVNLDTEALVSTKVINQKYKSDSLDNELEKQTELKTSFNFKNFKKSQVKETDYNSMLENLKTNKTNTYNTDNNTKIKIVEGEIKYAVKNKMKYFMNGVYDAYNKCKGVLKINKTNLKFIGFIIAAGSMYYISAKTIDFVMNTKQEQGQEKLQEVESLRNKEIIESNILGQDIKLKNKTNETSSTNDEEEIEDNIIPTLNELSNYFSASSKGIRDINMKLLDKYAKTHKEYSFKLADKGETIVVNVTANKKECLAFVGVVNDVNDFAYKLNEIEVDGNTRLIDDVADIACETKNTIKIRYDALAPK